MAPPSIFGDPKITQDDGSGSVFLDVVVTGADPAKTKWFLGENEIAATATYKFSHSDEGSNKKKLRCEIKVCFGGWVEIGGFELWKELEIWINLLKGTGLNKVLVLCFFEKN